MQQGLRRIEVCQAEQFEQQRHRCIDIGMPSLPEMFPQPQILCSIAVLEQLLLSPADQRRDQQAGQCQIIERLRGKAQCSDQIAHREWRAQPEPVNPRNRHPGGMEPRHDQPGQLLALANQHHDVPGSGPARPLTRPAPFEQWEARFHPNADLPRDPVCQLPISAGEPALIALLIVAEFVRLGHLRADHTPQRDIARAVLTDMRLGPIGQAEAKMPDLANRHVDEIKHRLRRAE